MQELEQLKKVVVTDDMIRFWFAKHRERRSWAPKKPYCKLCSTISRNRRKWDVKYFKKGELVYKVEFANGTESYYHIECMDNPKDTMMRMKVENIKRLDKDKWANTRDFIDSLRGQNLPNKEIISRIMERFNCSHTTAWRRLSEAITSQR